MQAPTSSVFRQTLSRFATGVSVVTGHQGADCQGVTINSLASVSLDPPLVLFSLKKNSPRYAFFKECKDYAISILSAPQQGLADHFARTGAIPPHFPLREKSTPPLFQGALAHLKGMQDATHEGGDHTIFVVRLTALDFDPQQMPLLFYASQYHTLPQPKG